jgi:hypothetical protein
MALKKTVQTSFGVEVIDAYHRVEGIRIVNKNKIAYQLRTYTDKNLESFRDVIYGSAYDMTGANPIAQAYEYLKTLPEFAGAEDC